MFTYQTTIKLHDTDAAGLLFFSHQLTLAHDAYEGFLEHIGIGFPSLLKEKDYFIPIVHAEADYKKPLFVGDVIEIQIRVENVGKISFILIYSFLNQAAEIVGTAQTVHVATDKNTQKKIPLPQELQEKLTAFKNK